MTSFSASDYQAACIELVQAALRHPPMYFQSLRDFESVMRGHETAFRQLTSVEREKMFHSQFSKWLYERYGLSCSSGWAYAIDAQCKERGDDPVTVFGIYAKEFFSDWGRVGTVGGDASA